MHHLPRNQERGPLLCLDLEKMDKDIDVDKRRAKGGPKRSQTKGGLWLIWGVATQQSNRRVRRRLAPLYAYLLLGLLGFLFVRRLALL